jgi:hypothetical protein
MTNSTPIQTSFQKELAAEKAHLTALLAETPTKRECEIANHRIEDIDMESKIDGWLSSKSLKPPE